MDIKSRVARATILFAIVFEVIGFASSGSWNPLKFWGSAGSLVRVALVVTGGLSVLGLLNWLAIRTISEDAECGDPECRNPNIRVFATVYGGIMKCPRCGRVYHKACWRRVHRDRSLADVVRNGCYVCSGGAEAKESARAWFDVDGDFPPIFRP